MASHDEKTLRVAAELASGAVHIGAVDDAASLTGDAISRGFDAGNYANAYETTDYEHALASLSPNRSDHYVAAFTLGFFSSYERDEMGDGVDAYDDAMALVGARMRLLGIAID
jgi:hypothetical protein